MFRIRPSIALCALAALILAAVSGSIEADQTGSPSEITLVGTVRDFRERWVEHGHTDFERRPDHGFGHYVGNVATQLGAGRKPVFTGNGAKVVQQWHDAQGRPISYTLFDESLGDTAGSLGAADTGGIASGASFSQWYDDVLGLNMAAPLAITLVRDLDGSYVFDDQLDADYSSLGGFFPIEDALFGNAAGVPNRNFHFTFELHTTFTYDASAEQVFRFVGDDDVFVFIDEKLVIDLGGVHSATEQYVDLDRLDLDDGKTYRLDFFFAERHRTQSNFRIVTNLELSTPDLPQISSIFD